MKQSDIFWNKTKESTLITICEYCQDITHFGIQTFPQHSNIARKAQKFTVPHKSGQIIIIHINLTKEDTSLWGVLKSCRHHSTAPYTIHHWACSHGLSKKYSKQYHKAEKFWRRQTGAWGKNGQSVSMENISG